MKHLVGNAQNDVAIYVDLIASEAAKHIAREPHLLSLAAEALPNITLEDSTITLEYDMGRVIGYNFVVETSAADTIFYAQIVRDSSYTRFTKNGKPLATQHLSLVLQQCPNDTSYNLHDIWIGHLAPPNPGSAQETATSKPYWEKHAFVFENQLIQANSLTKTCPY